MRSSPFRLCRSGRCPSCIPEITERFTELVVMIALMGAGLNLERVFSWRRLGVTWRLLVTMPLPARVRM